MIASTLAAEHCVTGRCATGALKAHDLYADDVLVGEVTRWLMDQRRIVLQLFMLSPDQRLHSTEVLRRSIRPNSFLHQGARIVSLGCGVGGMEFYWQMLRPDLRFTLVNQSKAQLDLCVCHGERWLGDLCDFRMRPRERAMLVVLAYVLGHVRLSAAMKAARKALAPGGRVIVLDVCDASHRFGEVLRYAAPTSQAMRRVGLRREDIPRDAWHEQPPDVLGREAYDVLPEASPGMWIGEA